MNIVLLGGNGYLGRTVSTQLLAKYPDAELTIVSRSGKNSLHAAQIHNVAVDLTDYTAVKAAMPAQIDYIIDFIGRPEKDDAANVASNVEPARTMQQLATDRNVRAMGMIGGILGPKKFVTTKAELIKQLQQGPIPVAYVEPTLIYGNGRSDSMSRMVPLLKFLGIFSKGLKPVHVDAVAAELIEKLTKY